MGVDYVIKSLPWWFKIPVFCILVPLYWTGFGRRWTCHSSDDLDDPRDLYLVPQQEYRRGLPQRGWR